VTASAERAGLRDVFGIAEFRSLWAAQILSVAGDQLAKVALTVLVYDRTRSALLTALTFAASFIPTFLGGVLLTGLADRLPRRQVMICCDLARMVLVALMAVAGVPLLALVALLFAVTLLGAPFTAARAATYPEILVGDSRYRTATAITLTTFQLAQVIGFASGGALTGLLGARPCLLADAATFAASAALVRFGVKGRPGGTGHAGGAVAGVAAGVRLVFRNPALRAPMLLGWLAVFYNSPEGIAAPFSRALGGGAVATGLLLAAPAVGYAAAAAGYRRIAQPRREALMRPLAFTCCAILIPVALHPGTLITLALLAASGACACGFQVEANAQFVQAAPPGQRSQAFGLAAAGMSLGQGAAFVIAGAAAEHLAPGTVVSAAGALGAGAALILTLASFIRRPAPSSPAAGPAR